jgi:hypothetical protein
MNPSKELTVISVSTDRGKVLRVLRMAVPATPCHECGRRHTRWHTAARCLFPKAIWISGGEDLTTFAYALLAHCKPCRYSGLTVTMWRDLAEAEQRKRMIDNCGCGGGCYSDHEIVLLRDFPEDDEWDGPGAN